jgi:hypothetical protein
MARSIFSDFLQSFPFWLVDVAPFDGLAFPILTPLFGFNSITAPEINIEQQEIREGNYYFTRKVVKGGSASNITLSRGSAWYDSDFWRWTRATLLGDTDILNGVSKIGGPTPRRTLLLIQFFAKNPFGGSLGATALGIGATAALAGVVGGAAPGGTGQSAIVAGLVGGGATFAALGAGNNIGPFEFAARLPAKAWVLSNVLPARFKVASDFDARSSEVSVSELELSVELVEEIALFA